MILIAYASKYGSTKEVAERIAQRLQKSGKQAEVKPVGQVADLGKAEAVIVGSALYQGGWLPEATAFVRKNAQFRFQFVMRSHGYARLALWGIWRGIPFGGR